MKDFPVRTFFQPVETVGAIPAGRPVAIIDQKAQKNKTN
jgi:hypothetical protein